VQLRRDPLERARGALEQSDLRGAVRLGWEAAIAGARTRSASRLAAVRELAIAVRDRAEGREEEGARGLAVYCETALNQIESGVRERSPLMRMLSRQPRDVAMKVCPDCAESVQPAARICRFCGYEFAPRAADR
jgi:hypothetical protein